jgi:hypothetical protein
MALGVLAALGAVGLGWIGGLAHAAYINLDLVELIGLPLLLTALLIWPLAQPAEGAPPERLIGPGLIVVGLAVTAVVRFENPYSPRFPEVAYVQYLMDQDAGRAWRFRPPGAASTWSDAVLRADGGQIRRLEHWAFSRPMDAAPAAAIKIPRADIGFARDPSGDLRLTLTPPAGVRYQVIRLQSDTPVMLVSLGGAPLDAALQPGRPTRIVWANGPKVELVLRPAGPGRLNVGALVTIEGWPAQAMPLPPRPANTMPFDRSDTTVVARSASFTW